MWHCNIAFNSTKSFIYHWIVILSSWFSRTEIIVLTKCIILIEKRTHNQDRNRYSCINNQCQRASMERLTKFKVSHLCCDSNNLNWITWSSENKHSRSINQSRIETVQNFSRRICEFWVSTYPRALHFSFMFKIEFFLLP